MLMGFDSKFFFFHKYSCNLLSFVVKIKITNSCSMGFKWKVRLSDFPSSMPNVSSWVSFENFLAFKFPPILYSHRYAFLVREHYTLWVVIRIGEFEVHVFFVSLNYTFIGVEIFISLPLYVYFSILSINGSIVTLAYFVHWNLIRSRPCLCKV